MDEARRGKVELGVSNGIHCRKNSEEEMEDKGSLNEEQVLKERIFNVHYPSCRPIRSRVILTETELVFEECDDDDTSEVSASSNEQERYPLNDLYGFHIVRKDADEPSLTKVYACIIFYSFIEKATTRSRVARVLEITQSKNSYEENLSVARDWALLIGTMIKQKFHLSWRSSCSIEKHVDKIFEELKTTDCDISDSQNSGDQNENGYSQETGEIDLQFDTETFSHVKSILFVRRFLVIVNPVSGQGRGKNLLEEYILPILADSGIEVDVLMTAHAGHAQSHIISSDLSNIDSIVSVGGDGLMNEIVNGLRSKDANDSTKFAEIPIGVVATGSGNGLARSMADYSSSATEYKANPTLHSTLAVARGSVVPVNLTEVLLDKKVHYSFLSVGWGLMSDIDIESEVLRSIGEIRFFIWSFVKLAKLKRYKAELSYIPCDASGSVNTRVKVDDEFVCVYSSCQSYIGSYMRFAPDAKRCDSTINLIYLPSSTSRLAAAKFLIKLDGGEGTHLDVNPVQYVKVKEFTLRCEGGIEGCLTMDGEQVHAEELTVKLSDSPMNVLSSSLG